MSNNLLHAQLATNEFWPMFHRNAGHSGTKKVYLQTSDIIIPEIKNTFQATGAIYSSPVIDKNGIIYFGTQDGYFYALTNNQIKWSTNLSGSIKNPGLGRTNVYFGCGNGYLYAFSPHGHCLWAYNTFQWIDWAGPVIDHNEVVYVGNGNNEVFAVSNENQKWVQFLTGNQVNCSPALSQKGLLYINSGDFILNSSRLYALNITNGNIEWTLPGISFTITSPAIDEDDCIYFGSGDTQHKIYAVTNGQVKWSYTAGSNIASSPALSTNHTVYFGCQDGYLYAVTNSTLKWKYLTSGQINMSSPLVDQKNNIYIGNNSGDLYSIGPGGILNWSIHLGGIIDSTPVIGTDGIIYIGNSEGRLFSIQQTAAARDKGPGRNKDLDKIIIVPNPFSLKKGQSGITFYHLPEEVRIRIYSLTGRLLSTLLKNDQEEILVWDNVLDILAPGIYFCQVSTSDNREINLKLVVTE